MNKIKELRNLNGLSQNDLAKKLGCNQTAVGKYERGQLEPNIQTLISLSKIFNVSVGYLIGVEDDFGNVIIKNPDDVNLTKDEQTVLDCFRELGPFEREAILIQIKALAGTAKESIKK